MKSVSVLCHLYYKDSLKLLLPYLKNFNKTNTRFLFNICSDTDYSDDVLQHICLNFEDAIVTCSPNVGKDIGGKLVLIDTYLKLGIDSDYLVLLHDKLSPHTATGNAWRKKLLAIIERENIEKILQVLSQDQSTGIIANSKSIMNEYDEEAQAYACTSNAELQLLREKYRIHTNLHHFVGGTMFWARSSVFQNFFNVHQPLEIRKTLEKGNILDHNKGTFSHAWERMLSWIVLNEGLIIKGI